MWIIILSWFGKIDIFNHSRKELDYLVVFDQQGKIFELTNASHWLREPPPTTKLKPAKMST